MGFLDDLLLGQGPSLQTRSLPTISNPQQALLDTLIARYGNKSPTPYTGQLSAGLSSGENLSLAALEERSRALAAPDTTLQRAGQTTQQLMDFNKQTGDASSYFTNAVQNPLLDSFSREILPNISRQFGGGSFFTTERQNAEGLARNDLLKALAAEKSRVELDQFNQSRNRALTAAGLAPQLTAADLARGQQQIDILQAQGLPRTVEQAGLDRSYAEFVRQQQQQQQNDEMARALALTPTIENIGMTDPGNAGLINTLLGALASGIGGQLGQGLGGGLGSLLGRLFGQGGGTQGAGADGGAPPATGTGGGSAIPGAIAGAAAGAGLPALIAGAQGGINSGVDATNAAILGNLGNLPMPSLPAGTPGGSATIFEGNFPGEAPNLTTLANQIGGGAAAIGGAGGLEGLLSGGIQGGIDATNAGILNNLGGLKAPSLALDSSLGGGGQLAGGASADTAVAGGSSVGQIASRALGIAGALYGGYNTVRAAAAGDTKGAALNGALTGASIGSVIPGIGTGVGALVGALAGVVGAQFGDQERPSEAAYGAYKKAPESATIRGWTPQQAGGALFEAIKSHTKSGNINRFPEVSQMYTAFGIHGGAQNQITNVQTQMQNFIQGVIRTAQQAGGLPTDPKELAKLDGQQIYYKLVAPAFAQKVAETTGLQDNAWSHVRSGTGPFQGILADYTDWFISGGLGTPKTSTPTNQPRPISSTRGVTR